MSRFFEDILEEEKTEIKKKVYNEPTQKTTQKLSKKEKLFMELQTRVFELEEDESKKAEKNIKKFLSELKKFEASYDQPPQFLKDFLLSEKVYVKGNKKIVDGFLSQYEEKAKECVEESVGRLKIEGSEKGEADELNKISLIEDVKERKARLVGLLDKTQSESVRVDVLVMLLSTSLRLKDFGLLIGTLRRVCDYLGNLKVQNILKNNLDFYFEEISTNLTDLTEYKDLLIKFKAVNPIVCERRLLELEYFRNQNFIETEFADFKLFKAIQKGDCQESNKIFNSLALAVIKSLKLEPVFIGYLSLVEGAYYIEDQIFLRIIREYALFTFKTGFYFNSVICFSYANANGDKASRLYIDLLCVILNSKIQQTEIFNDFLIRFKEFSSNPLLLPSCEPTAEVFRAFYLLHSFDLETCYSIINTIENGWKDKSVLLESVRGLLYK